MTDPTDEIVNPPPPEVLARLSASGPRRAFALIVLLSLGVLLVYLALASAGMEPIWRLFLVATGVAVLLLARHLRRATALVIELTGQELRDSAGRVLARVDDMRSVTQGAFAFKPSHGFSVRLKTRQPRVWAPGLWWRFGTRLGVGGVTAAAQAKFMSEILAALISQRETSQRAADAPEGSDPPRDRAP